MKTIKQIQNEIKKNTNRQNEINAEIEKLSFTQEIHSEAHKKNYAKCKELHEEAKQNDETIKALCDELTALKLAEPLLKQNLKAVTVAGCLEALCEIMPKYDGKQYGEKTATKIREEVSGKGYWFYFSGYVFEGSRTRIEISLYDGQYHGSSDAATVYCRHDENNHDIPFITTSNTINAAAFDNLSNPYKYTESITKQVKAIKKAIQAHRKASEAAYTTQSALNALLSRDSNHVDNIKYGKFQVTGMYF